MGRDRRLRRQRRNDRNIHDEVNTPELSVDDGIRGLMKNIKLTICLMIIIYNPMPPILLAISGPSIYLFIKTLQCPILFLLFLRLNNERDNVDLLYRVLVLLQFVTASTYGPCIMVNMGVDYCILESIVMVAAGTIVFLSFLIRAAIKETGPTLLVIVVVLYFASQVVDFSLSEAKFWAILIMILFYEVFRFEKRLHAFKKVDDHLHNGIAFIKSKGGYYGLYSFVMICSLNAIITGIANLKGTLF